MAARHMAGGIPKDWHQESVAGGTRPYRGRHFKEAPEQEALVEEVSSNTELAAPIAASQASKDEAASSEARAFIEEILRELQLEFEPRAKQPEPASIPEPELEPEPEQASTQVPEVEHAVAEPEVAAPAADEPMAATHAVDAELVPSLGSEFVPSASQGEAKDEPEGLGETQQLNRLSAEEWVDELESTLQMRPLTEEVIDELEATLPIDHERVREALRKVMPAAGETSDRLEVAEQLSEVGQAGNAAMRQNRQESVPVIRLESNAVVRKEDDWHGGTSQRTITRRERRPFSFLASIGARVSKLLHLDDR